MTAVAITVASLNMLPAPGRAALKTNLKPHQLATQTQLVIAQNWRTCQRLGREYREVLSFETPNQYVNICLQRLTARKSRYVYVAEPKNNPDNRLVLTAQPLSKAKYQASSTDTVYAVTNYLQVPDASRGGFELVITQNGRVVQQENSIRGFDLSNTSPGSQSARLSPADTIFTFRTRTYAVRLYRQRGQTVMNLFNRRSKITLLQSTPVKAEQTPEGYSYTNLYGKVQVQILQPQASSYSIQIGDNAPEPAI